MPGEVDQHVDPLAAHEVRELVVVHRRALVPVIEFPPQALRNRVLGVGRHVERVRREMFAVVRRQVAVEPVGDRVVAQVRRHETHAQPAVGRAVVVVRAPPGPERSFQSRPPGAMLVERALPVVEAEVVEQEQPAALQRVVVRLSCDLALVGRDRLRAAAEEGELLADPRVEAGHVRPRGTRLPEARDRARRIVRGRGDRAGEEQQVGVARQPFQRVIAGRAGFVEPARRESRVRPLVIRDQMRRVDRRRLVESVDRGVVALAVEQRLGA